jgi:gliding motility-associated protein GldM
MAGYKETPRQKMIGMMYLVLTALLALNVSKDILNAFVIVNQGLVTSQENTTSKNELIYANFAKAMMESPLKVKPYYDNAIKAKKYTEEIAKYIAELRTEIIAWTEYGVKDKASDPAKWTMADTIDLGGISAKDSYDKPMEILIGQSEEGADGKGKVLQTKLETFKKNMIDLLFSKKDKDASEKSFPIDTKDAYSFTEGKNENWVRRNFYHTVLAADVALLNKFLIDVKTVEGDVISKLYSAVDASSFKFDKIAAKVVSESNYILLGSEYKANIFLAAYDSKKSPDIFIGDTISHVGEPLDKAKFEDGMGVYTTGGSGVGEKKYTGWISIVKPGETTPTFYNFSSSYVVGQPSATVSADKMNVFYIGVDNPVTISVPGVPNDKVRPSISAGTLTPKGAGKYIVKVSTGYTETTVNVAAQIGSKTQSMGATKFRVKRVPDPVAYIGGVKSGAINKNVIAASKMIVAKLDNFDFELTFIVTSFTFLMNIKGDIIPTACSGNMLPAAVLSKLSSAAPGTRVYFEDIKAKGPDGTPRTLSPINLKLL